MPPTVAYLDAAAWAPIPSAVRAAGETGMLMKRQPWSHPRDEAAAWAERTRAAAAALIGAEADDIAIMGAISQAMATAARNLTARPGGRLLRVADEFPSHRLVWDRLAATLGLEIETVPRPADSDWTAALLDAIARPFAPPLAIATLSPLHWSDGTIIDLDRIAPAVHAAGAALVVDATQAVGAIPVAVARWQPDFLAFPTYKWVLGPYSMAFLYAAPHRRNGTPLEEHSGNLPTAIGARRFDKGEPHDPIALPMAATGMELVAHWGPAAISERLLRITGSLAAALAELGFDVPPRALRSPHIIGGRLRDGLPPDLVDGLRAEQVFVSDRLGALRISPHVWTTEDDVDRLVAALQRRLQRPHAASRAAASTMSASGPQ